MWGVVAIIGKLSFLWWPHETPIRRKVTRGDGDNESIPHPDTPRHLSAISSVFFPVSLTRYRGQKVSTVILGRTYMAVAMLGGSWPPLTPGDVPAWIRPLWGRSSRWRWCVYGEWEGSQSVPCTWRASWVRADQVGGNSRPGFLTPGWVSPSHVVWELVGREECVCGGGGVMFISHWVFLEWNRRRTHRSICFSLDASKWNTSCKRTPTIVLHFPQFI